LCSVRLAFFHTNQLLIELDKQEKEIRCRKDDRPIKKLTNIDHHGPVPYSLSTQTPDPSHFSLPTTFKGKVGAKNTAGDVLLRKKPTLQGGASGSYRAFLTL
jgi:hypothetical protein